MRFVYFDFWKTALKWAKIDWMKQEEILKEKEVRTLAIEKGEDPEKAVEKLRTETLALEKDIEINGDPASRPSSSSSSLLNGGRTKASLDPMNLSLPIEMNWQPLNAACHSLLLCCERVKNETNNLNKIVRSKLKKLKM